MFTMFKEHNSSYLLPACENGHTEFVQLILDNGGTLENDTSSLVIACKHGNLELVKLLIENGIDVNQRGSANSRAIDAPSTYPLTQAVCSDNIELVKYLVESGADVNKDNKDAIAMACYCGYSEIVEYLISQNANVNYTSTPRAWSPMQYAVNNGRTDVVRVILESGSFNCTDEKLNDYINDSELREYNDVAELLKKYGARHESI